MGSAEYVFFFNFIIVVTIIMIYCNLEAPRSLWGWPGVLYYYRYLQYLTKIPLAEEFKTLHCTGKCEPGVGFVVSVGAWDPRVLSSSPVFPLNLHQGVYSACHPSEVGEMSISTLVIGTLHQWHSRAPNQ